MAPLQFQPLSSQPTPSFWSALNTLKLDKLKLDDSQQDISGWIEEGKEVVDREAVSSGSSSVSIGVDGAFSVGGGAFGEDGDRCAQNYCQRSRTLTHPRPPPTSVPLRGIFKNFNTIEEFRATDPKKELFNQVAESVSCQ